MANWGSLLTAEQILILADFNAAFKSGDSAAYILARRNPSQGIRKAKRLYAQKLNSHFMNEKDSRRLWQGFPTITDYKPPHLRICQNDPSLPDKLNDFFARFEVKNTPRTQTKMASSSNQVLQLSTAGVKKVLTSINPRKAAGPDNIPGHVLKDCAEQLKDVFTDIFNISLSQAVVPNCLKSAIIIPIPKKSNPVGFNDFRPVAEMNY